MSELVNSYSGELALGSAVVEPTKLHARICFVEVLTAHAYDASRVTAGSEKRLEYPIFCDSKSNVMLANCS